MALGLGLSSITFQVLAFREFSCIHQSSELGTAVFFAAWLAWVGVGALVARVVLARASEAATVAIASFYPLAFACQVLFIWNLRSWAGLAAFDSFPVDSLMVWTLLATAPTSLFTGFLFSWVASVPLTDPASRAPTSPASFPASCPKNDDRSRVVIVYGIESIGAAAAGLLLTLAFSAQIRWATILMAVLIVWFGSLTARCVSSGLRVRGAILGAASILSFVSLMTPVTDALNQTRLRALALPDVWVPLHSVDTAFSNITIAASKDTIGVFADGTLEQVYPAGFEASKEAALYLSAVNKPAPAAVVATGYGEELACELARAGARVTLVQLDEAASRFIQPWVPQLTNQCLEEHAVERVYGDVFRLLSESTATFDFAVVGGGATAVRSMSRLGADGVVQTIAARISEGGFLFFYPGVESALRGTRGGYLLFAAAEQLRKGFPRVTAIQGGSVILVGGKSRLLRGPTAMAATYDAHWNSHFPYVQPEHVASFVEKHTTARLSRLIAPQAAAATGMADPWLEWFGLDEPESRVVRMLLTSTDSVAKVLWATAAAVAVFCLGLLLAGAFKSGFGHVHQSSPGVQLETATGLQTYRRPGSVVLLAGLVSMGTQLLLIQQWETRLGTLHSELGLLSAAFMSGLGLTSWLGPRLMVASKRLTSRESSHRFWSGFYPAVLLIPGLALAAASTEAGSGSVVRLLLLTASLISGLGSGLSIALAVGSYGVGEDKAGACVDKGRFPPSDYGLMSASWLEALDQAGGVTGALLIGLVLLPKNGPVHALAFLALVSVTVCLWRSLPNKLGVSTADCVGPGVAIPRIRVTLVAFVGGIVLASVLWILFSGNRQPTQSRLGFQDRVHPIHSSDRPASDRVQDNRNEIKDVCVDTFDYANNVNGYSGPMSLDLCLDSHGNIDNLDINWHSDTPEYVMRIQTWVQGLEGLPLDAFGRWLEGSDKPPVDALTGATMTSRAVMSSLGKTASASFDITYNSIDTLKSSLSLQEFLSPLVFIVAVIVLLCLYAVFWGRPGSGARDAGIVFLALGLSAGIGGLREAPGRLIALMASDSGSPNPPSPGPMGPSFGPGISGEAAAPGAVDQTGTDKADKGPRGHPNQGHVDAEVLRNKVENHQASDREALYYRVIPAKALESDFEN